MLNENKSEKKQKHKKEKKKLTGTKKALIVLAVLLGIVLIVMFSFSLTVKHYLGKMTFQPFIRQARISKRMRSRAAKSFPPTTLNGHRDFRG